MNVAEESDISGLQAEVRAALDELAAPVALAALRPFSMRTCESFLWERVGTPNGSSNPEIKRSHPGLEEAPFDWLHFLYDEVTGNLVHIRKRDPQVKVPQTANFMVFTANLRTHSMQEWTINNVAFLKIGDSFSIGQIVLYLSDQKRNPDAVAEPLPFSDQYVLERYEADKSDTDDIRLVLDAYGRHTWYGSDGIPHALITAKKLDIRGQVDKFYKKFGGALAILAYEEYLASLEKSDTTTSEPVTMLAT